MGSNDQAVFVLKLILALGPLAVYFLGLGLVNSQARPRMVNARADFILLTVAFVPLIAMPMWVLIEHGHLAWVGTVIAAVLLLFFSLLPARDLNNCVVYNCSSAQCRRLLIQAAAKLGWQVEKNGVDFTVRPAGLKISLSPLPWLRSVTLRVEASHESQSSGAAKLMGMLRGEMNEEAMLPSPTGASLVVIGTVLLGLPMWYFFHHIDAIVEVVKRILFA